MNKDKIRTYLFVILVIAIAIFNLTTIRSGHSWGDDFAMYLQHTINIAEANNYANSGYIYNPLRPTLGPKAYPPIYPLLLLPLYKLFGLNFTAFKIENILFFILFLFIIFLSFKNYLSHWAILAVIVIVGFNPVYWSFKDNINSDLLFLFLSYSSLFWIDKLYNNYQIKTFRHKEYFYSFITALLIYLSCGTRSIGIIIIPSLICYELIYYRKLSQNSIIITAIVVSLLTLQKVFVRGESSYFDQFSIKLYFIAFNTLHYTNTIGDFWQNGNHTIIKYSLLIILTILSLLGYYLKIKRKLSIYEFYYFVYWVMIIIWPARQDARFLIPIMPIYIFYIFYGINNLDIFKVGRRRVIIYAGLITLIFISYIGQYANYNMKTIKEGINKSETTELFNYIKYHTSNEDIIIFEKPRALFLFTGRKSSALHKLDEGDLIKLYYRRPWIFLSSNKMLSGQGVDEDILLNKYYHQLWKYIKLIKANYIVTMPLDKVYFGWFINAYKDNLIDVFHNSDFTVYKIKTYSYNE